MKTTFSIKNSKTRFHKTKINALCHVMSNSVIQYKRKSIKYDKEITFSRSSCPQPESTSIFLLVLSCRSGFTTCKQLKDYALGENTENEKVYSSSSNNIYDQMKPGVSVIRKPRRQLVPNRKKVRDKPSNRPKRHMGHSQCNKSVFSQGSLDRQWKK